MGTNGVIIVDKPQDWTSMDVCAKLRGVFHEKRVGHAGTLDPMATGVLPVFIGRATRAVDFVSEGEKEYVAGLLLGVTTDTQDITGTPLPAPAPSLLPTREAVEEALKGFVGDIEQLPPMYSAIKIKGKKLYELARKGVEVERKPRKITIFELELLDQTAPDRYRLRVVCSKGTYIRTLCHDVGEKLGCGGCMAALRRTRVGRFTLAEARTLEDILSSEDPTALLTGVEECFDAPKAVISGLALKRALCGNPFPLKKADGTYRIFDEAGNFLLLGQCNGQECKLIKSFYEVT